jgi:hypothetical protein
MTRRSHGILVAFCATMWFGGVVLVLLYYLLEK